MPRPRTRLPGQMPSPAFAPCTAVIATASRCLCLATRAKIHSPAGPDLQNGPIATAPASLRLIYNQCCRRVIREFNTLGAPATGEPGALECPNLRITLHPPAISPSPASPAPRARTSSLPRPLCRSVYGSHYPLRERQALQPLARFQAAVCRNRLRHGDFSSSAAFGSTTIAVAISLFHFPKAEFGKASRRKLEPPKTHLIPMQCIAAANGMCVC